MKKIRVKERAIPGPALRRVFVKKGTRWAVLGLVIALLDLVIVFWALVAQYRAMMGALVAMIGALFIGALGCLLKALFSRD